MHACAKSIEQTLWGLCTPLFEAFVHQITFGPTPEMTELGPIDDGAEPEFLSSSREGVQKNPIIESKKPNNPHKFIVM